MLRSDSWPVLNTEARTRVRLSIGSFSISGSATPLPSAMSHACCGVTRPVSFASCHGLVAERAIKGLLCGEQGAGTLA